MEGTLVAFTICTLVDGGGVGVGEGGGVWAEVRPTHRVQKTGSIHCNNFFIDFFSTESMARNYPQSLFENKPPLQFETAISDDLIYQGVLPDTQCDMF